MLLRIEALLRRAKVAVSKVLDIGKVHIDTEARTVYIDGEEIAMSAREFNLYISSCQIRIKLFHGLSSWMSFGQRRQRAQLGQSTFISPEYDPNFRNVMNLR